jgi:hypothetical protein
LRRVATTKRRYAANNRNGKGTHEGCPYEQRQRHFPEG